MQVPQSLCLNSQTFNSKFLEFVWQFPTPQGEKNQIVYKIYKDGNILLEEGIIDATGEYKRGYTTSGTLTTKNISFSELIELKTDVVKFLNDEKEIVNN
jgi:hypothetical protein